MTSPDNQTVELTSRDWFGKVVAAVILGFTLAIALTCTFEALFSRGDPFSARRGRSRCG